VALTWHHQAALQYDYVSVLLRVATNPPRWTRSVLLVSLLKSTIESGGLSMNSLNSFNIHRSACDCSDLPKVERSTDLCEHDIIRYVQNKDPFRDTDQLPYRSKKIRLQCSLAWKSCLKHSVTVPAQPRRSRLSRMTGVYLYWNLGLSKSLMNKSINQSSIISPKRLVFYLPDVSEW